MKQIKQVTKLSTNMKQVNQAVRMCTTTPGYNRYSRKIQAILS